MSRQGPNAVPSKVFTYSGLIPDVVESAVDDPAKQQLLSVVEYCLRPLSQLASVSTLPTKKPTSITTDRPEAPQASLYPPLSVDPSPTDRPLINPVFKKPLAEGSLDPGDADTLEEEVVRPHKPDWQPSASAPPQGSLPTFHQSVHPPPGLRHCLSPLS